jgi:hypothetical protein
MNTDELTKAIYNFCGLKLGMPIFRVEYCRARTEIICGFCAGDGNISGKDGHNILCPLCKGTGYRSRLKEAVYEIEDLGSVRDICLKVLSTGINITFLTSGSEKAEKTDKLSRVEIEYSCRCEHTGDPRIDRYATSHAEAEKICKALEELGNPYPANIKKAISRTPSA